MRELPEGWEWKRLEDIAEINPKLTHNKLPDDYEVTFLPMRCVEECTGCIDATLVKKYGEVKKGYTPIQEGDLLFAKITPCIENGKIAVANNLINGIGFASTEFHTLRFQSNNNVKYFQYFLMQEKIRQEAAKNMTGTAGQQRVPVIFLKKLYVPVPQLPVQRRIVEILEHADALRHLRTQADAETQKLLQSVFYDMFGDPVRNEKGWEVKKLNNISEIVSGITKGRELKEQNTKFVPYLRVANVQDGFLDLSEIKEIEVLDYEIEKYKLKKGDILLTEGGDRDKLGRGYVWNLEIPVCIHQNHIFRVRLNAKFLNPEFLSFLIGSNYGKRYFAKSAKQTTGIASINSTQLKNFPVLLPPIALQQQFSYMVQEVEQLRMKQSIIRLEVGKMYNGLIQQAFIGELTSL